MLKVEFWHWSLKSAWRDTRYRSPIRMSAATAAAYPDAVRIDGTCELRDVPETDDELRLLCTRDNQQDATSRRGG